MTRSRAILLAGFVLACTPRLEERHGEPTDATGAAAAKPVERQRPTPTGPLLPSSPGELAPAFSQKRGSGALDGKALADAVDGCAHCHADVAAQWRSSAHAFASFDNPIYRVSVEGFRKANNLETSRFCAGCHDSALLVDGAMDEEVVPTDTRAHAGVTCLTCHAIDKVSRDGNGSYRLNTDQPLLPTPDDAASIVAHAERMALPPLRTAEMCASCHRAFLGRGSGHDHHIAGADDYAPWQRSVYAGSRLDRVDVELDAKQCRDCHMPAEEAPLGDAAAEDGRVRSHRFLGGHTWLASMRGDQAQVARVQRFLKRAATIRVSAIRHGSDVRAPADGASLAVGESIDIEVTVRNTGVGHHFPGGTRDMHDVWIELTVRDAEGVLLATAGGDGDPNSHILRSTVLDEEGRPVLARQVHNFRAGGYDNTIPPRDRYVVPYRWTVPDGVALPVQMRARLLHRSREAALQAATCNETKSPRGRAFAEVRRQQGLEPLDACAPQPITVVAKHRALVGGAAAVPLDAIDEARLLLDHGSALSHSLVEQIDDARPSLEAALVALTDQPGQVARQLRAATHHALAKIEGRQGRIGEMQQRLAAAEAQVPGHPAYAFTRGTALAAVWRHRDAVTWLSVAAEGAPLDDRGWTRLAIAQGSLAHHEQALAAARRALGLSPRGPDALRVQALALRGLKLPEDVQRGAMDAFLTHRRRDDAPQLRAACSLAVPGCALERTPAHRHLLIDQRK